MKIAIKKIFVVALVFTQLINSSQAGATICKRNAANTGFDKVAENHGYSNPFRHQHLLDCDDPGTKPCTWTTYQPGSDELTNLLLLQN